MVQKYFLYTFSILFLFTAPSFAQHKGQTTETEIKPNSKKLFPRNTYALSFFGNPQKDDSKLTMRFQAVGVVAGCATMKKGHLSKADKEQYKNIKDGAQVDYLGKKVRVAILDTQLKISDKDPRYGNHDCTKSHNISYVDIDFDRDDLIKKGTNKLELKSVKYGNFGEHELDVNKDRLIFKVKTSEGEYWPTFWFFPSNSITLYATGAKQGENVTELIREFGISHGLIPMEDVLDGYNLPHTALSHVFFADPTGKFINRLNEDNQSAFVGKIKPTRTVYGVDGPREESYGVDLHVSYAVQEQPE